MKPERWQAVKDLFNEALEREPETRAAYLAEVERTDPEAAAEVRALLSAQGRADSLFGSATRTRNVATLAPGTRLGPYEIVSLVGAGGMGEVYKARDTRLDRTVAVKVLAPQVAADPGLRSRFEREARAISRLSHPHICALYDVGQQDGVSFLVMEYLDGETLAARLTRGPLPLDEAVRLASEIAEALEEAHRQGIVHRDLKPANVVLTRAGAKLLDFGIAKLRPGAAAEDLGTATGPSALTAEGQIIGTLPYMAPEQLEGKPADARTDVFAFGLVVYEMVTGRRAFEASSRASLIAAVLAHEAPSLSRFQPLAPAALDAVVRRCLAKRPEDRWPSCADLLAHLRAALAPGPAGAAATGGRGLRSLAVLPFTWVGEPADEYLGFGMADALITRMGNLRQIVVRPTSAVRRYLDAGRDAVDAGRELAVDAVLDGRIQRSGDKVRVTVQLIDVPSAAPVWGERFDEKLSDIFQLQDSISQRLVLSLPLELSTEERRRLTRHHTDDPEALKAYVRGRYHWFKRTEEGLRQGIEHFQLAIERDAGYALPYAGLADCYMVLGMLYGTLPLKEAVDRARAGATRALELDEGLGEPHATLGIADVFAWKWDEAESHFFRARELSPNYAATHNWRAGYLAGLGRLDEAIAEARAAAEADPLSAVWSMGVGHMLYLARRYEEAIEQEVKTLELDRRFYMAHWILGLAYEERGRLDEAVASMERAHALSDGSPLVHGFLGRTYALAGRRDDASRVLTELQAIARQRCVPPDVIAVVHSALGDPDGAFEWLRRGCDERAFWLPYHVGAAPTYDALRRDARFADVLRRMGLPGS